MECKSCGSQDGEYKNGVSKKNGRPWKGWKCSQCGEMIFVNDPIAPLPTSGKFAYLKGPNQGGQTQSPSGNALANEALIGIQRSLTEVDKVLHQILEVLEHQQ